MSQLSRCCCQSQCFSHCSGISCSLSRFMFTVNTLVVVVTVQKLSIFLTQIQTLLFSQAWLPPNTYCTFSFPLQLFMLDQARLYWLLHSVAVHAGPGKTVLAYPIYSCSCWTRQDCTGLSTLQLFMLDQARLCWLLHSVAVHAGPGKTVLASPLCSCSCWTRQDCAGFSTLQLFMMDQARLYWLLHSIAVHAGPSKTVLASPLCSCSC